jgi:Carboxypeptidase regulatory-like domain
MRGLKAILFVSAWFVVLPAAAYAQASITGVVRDTSGAVLPGVTVEASSPALIEKVRSAVTDGSGQYRIVDLRPGTYAVSFALTGFSGVKREGIELTGSFVATVNAEMRVGAIAETITVTGETPVVDIQSTTAQRTLTKDVVDAIPTGRSHLDQAVLIPGLSSSQGATRGVLMDVGGTNNLQNTLVSIHGGRQSDTRLMVDGIRIGNIAGEGQWTNYVPDQGGAQEVAVDYSAISAEQITGGLRINLIPREGGNTYRGSLFATGVNDSWQQKNVTDELTARGLGAPNRMKRAYDINPSGGGPIIRDKLWFYSSARFQDNESFIAGTYANKNAGDPTKWLYEADTSQQSVFSIKQNSVSTRLTLQAAERHKLSFYYDTQSRNWNDGVVNVSPEAITMWRFPRLGLAQASWSSPLTSRLLLEVRGQIKPESFYDLYNREDPIYKSMIPVIDQFNGLFYRAPAANGQASIYGRTEQNLRTFQTSLSYVTGAHAFKVGFVDTYARAYGRNEDNDYHMTFRVNNGIPNQLTQRATPTESLSVMKAELGIYAQDKWTVNRVTLSGGLRFDYLNGYFPELHLGPAFFVPNRNITFPETDSISWKDLSPRVGAAYDLFGDGKTALKMNIGRYVLASASTVNSPSARVSNTITRTWTDANSNFRPDCDLFNTGQQDLRASGGDFCGIMSNTTFGQQQVATTFYNEDMIRGYGVRPYNWEFSAGVQRELMPKVGVEFGYFRRWFGNFQVTDNRTNTAADFTRYSITAPLDSRLPGGGGYTIDGLYDLNPDKTGQTNNYVTFADDYGKQIEHWNGVDITINARPGGGTLLQGGVSTGRTSFDNCEIRAAIPEFLATTPFQATIPLTTNAFCHVDEKFQTQVKLLGTYMIPRVDLRFAATFQSVPGFPIIANYNAPNAAIRPSLGRDLSGGAANATVNLVSPGTMYNDRANQLDVRFTKLLRFGRARTAINFDIANSLNTNPVLLQQNNFAVWQVPQKILEARLFKLSAQIDF